MVLNKSANDKLNKKNQQSLIQLRPLSSIMFLVIIFMIYNLHIPFLTYELDFRAHVR